MIFSVWGINCWLSSTKKKKVRIYWALSMRHSVKGPLSYFPKYKCYLPTLNLPLELVFILVELIIAFSNYYDYINTITAQQHSKITAHQASPQTFLFSLHLPENWEPSYNSGATMQLGESFCEKWKQKILLRSPWVSGCCLGPLNETWESRQVSLKTPSDCLSHVSVLWHHNGACLSGGSLLCGSLRYRMILTTGFLEVQLSGHSFTEGSRSRNARCKGSEKGSFGHPTRVKHSLLQESSLPIYGIMD